MLGTYCLIISVSSVQTVDTTALGILEFAKGYWIYVGSAQGSGSTNLSNRLKRHFRSEKTIHWHIDHLLDTDAKLIEAVWAESSGDFECSIAQVLEGKTDFIWGPKGFGSSDCTRSCHSHMLYYQGEGSPTEEIEAKFRSLGLTSNSYSKKQPITQ
ncbi:MAG: GIY-YIG nuclease family protein [Candidatus Thorarchaeota archaeon]